MNEQEMKQTGTQLIAQSNTFIIKTQQDYNNAVEVCKDIKVKIKVIEDYWEPLKTDAFKAHKNLCAKERELLTPYTEAESSIKVKMTAYQKQVMEDARLLREEQERYRKEEEARLLELAVKAAEKGQEEHSEFLVEQAQEIHVARFEQPKQMRVAGSAVKMIWKARIINEELVPIMANGVVIRKIDESALNKMAVMIKGKSNIPGVEFYEDINISVSRG